ncbi:hypothetical protein SAMN02745857_02960 [Andreprevotia lacus DSM 23236]|jgi:hypothetical protein|uniref:DUF4189 domain-containing protein n=1 Tax=Andreprevotia lacus DSM 23236 TaxID=1121001 RepID=A0A1W1XW06_9NEIS|nr:hypothetical protein [Andreprevotia lacus]SMC27731.1 hypothetical protein SAMN02745857_02960 [Andreprevotia lacus DSM 23236]
MTHLATHFTRLIPGGLLVLSLGPALAGPASDTASAPDTASNNSIPLPIRTGQQDTLDGYRNIYLPAPTGLHRHKAFVLSVDFAAGYAVGAETRQAAIARAKDQCERERGAWARPCELIDIDGEPQALQLPPHETIQLTVQKPQHAIDLFGNNKAALGSFLYRYSHHANHRLFMRAPGGAWQNWYDIRDAQRLNDVAAQWCRSQTGKPDGCEVLDINGQGLDAIGAPEQPYFELKDMTRIETITEHWGAAVSQFTHGYRYAGGHKAFAYKYGQGAYYWDAGFASRKEAEDQVLTQCRRQYAGSKGTCHLINVDGEWVD